MFEMFQLSFIVQAFIVSIIIGFIVVLSYSWCTCGWQRNCFC